MKTALILSTAILLTGCQTTPQQEELLLGLAQGMQNAADNINRSTQYNYQYWNQMQYQNQNRNMTCRSRVVGNAVQTNCW